MKIKVNNDMIEFGGESRLIFLLEKLLLIDKNGIAVAVNAEVVPKKEWPHFSIHEHDEIIILEATQGG